MHIVYNNNYQMKALISGLSTNKHIILSSLYFPSVISKIIIFNTLITERKLIL